jgi:hypothetical protein
MEDTTLLWISARISGNYFLAAFLTAAAFTAFAFHDHQVQAAPPA